MQRLYVRLLLALSALASLALALGNGRLFAG
jgi:hypothetical protein